MQRQRKIKRRVGGLLLRIFSVPSVSPWFYNSFHSKHLESYRQAEFGQVLIPSIEDSVFNPGIFHFPSIARQDIPILIMSLVVAALTMNLSFSIDALGTSFAPHSEWD